MAKPAAKGSVLQFALIFALVYLGTNLVLGQVFPQWFGKQDAGQGIELRMKDATVKGGHHPVVTLQNHMDVPYEIRNRCPAMPPVDIFYRAPDATAETPWKELTATGTVLPCVPPQPVAPKGIATMDLGPWKYSLFSEYGFYQARLPFSHVETGTGTAQAGTGSTSSDASLAASGTLIVDFTIAPPGVITQTFRAFVTKPLLNLLIAIAGWLPGHNLGWAIILLTLVVKLVLFFPTQHAMEGQKRLQALQPKMDELKKKYANDPQKLNAETMKLWKEEKANPLQSCLPTLIQFPILIGLFYVIRDGSTLTLSRHLIYGFHEHLSWTFSTNFFGMDLLLPNPYILCPILVILQFAQMKLAFAMAKRKQSKQKVIDITPEGKEPVKDEKKPLDQQELQQRMMTYGLPLMIGFFSLSIPSAVGVYWAVSTLFAIIQQLVVNRKVIL